MKYTKVFETYEDYEEFKVSEYYVKPNVSSVIENRKPYFNPKYQWIRAKIDVTSTYSTKILNQPQSFDQIEIDGQKIQGVSSAYTFDTIGEHTIKYRLKDPTTVGISAFTNCSNLTYIKLPSTIKTIERYAFCSCGGIKNINIPDGVEKIDDYAFGNCGIVNVNIPDSVTSMGDYAFY